MSPKFTIICSTRNRPSVLAHSLLLTRKVLPENVPIIVLDDASDDPHAVRNAVAEIPNVSVIRSGKRIGPGAGRNRCIFAAQTKFCLSLDDDCYLEKLPDLSRWFEERPGDADIAAVGFRYYCTTDGSYGPARDVPGLTNSLIGGACLLRRQAILDTGGYLDWLVFGAEDTELARRLGLLGYRIFYEPSVVVMHEHTPVDRDERWESFYYTRNAFLLETLHFGLLRGGPYGLFRALRRGFFHTTVPSQTLKALVCAIMLVPHCLRERKRIFSAATAPAAAVSTIA